MASMFEQPGNGTLFLGGQKISGQDIREQNVLATQAIANVVKSSFGPSGLDKMMVDDIGDVTVTNDGATILSLLDVEPPPARSSLTSLTSRTRRLVTAPPLLF